MTMLIFLALILFVVALGLGIWMGYVWRKRNNYTEKRFSSIALSHCSSLTLAYLSYLFDYETIYLDNPYFPLPFQKLVGAIILLVYFRVVSGFVKSWNGGMTQVGHDARVDGKPSGMLTDGWSELRRWWKSLPPESLYDPGPPRPGQLPRPMENLDFPGRVRALVLARWREYVIDDSAWSENARCWYGSDSALMRPLMVVCASDESELDYRRIRHQANHLDEEHEGRLLKLMLVLENISDPTVLEQEYKSLSNDLNLFDFETLLQEALPLGRYRKVIDDEFQGRSLPNSTLTLADTIVPTHITTVETELHASIGDASRRIELDDYLKSWLKEPAGQHIALLGDYGQGKSTAALQLTHQLLNDAEWMQLADGRMPVLIRLTGLSPKNMPPEDLLGTWANRLGMDGRALLALHRAGKTILIFDAFDETANVWDRADRLDHFGALWRLACPGSKLIFTGRPNFFLDDEELKRALRITQGNGAGPYCTALRILPFSTEQISRTLRGFPPGPIQTLLKAIADLPRLREIAERPSLLFQLAQLWVSGRINANSQEIVSATIIEKFVLYSLERQMDKQRSVVGDERAENVFIPLRLSELTYFTAACALAALDDGRNNSLPTSVFDQTVKEALVAVEDGHDFSRRPEEQGSLAMFVGERFQDRVDPVQACAQAVRTHGIIEHDPTRIGVYKFSHKSFAEALAGSVIASGIVGKDDEYRRVWAMRRARGLLGQPTVWNMCVEIASVRHTAGLQRVTEHSLYANLMGIPDTVFNRWGYEMFRTQTRVVLRLLENVTPVGDNLFPRELPSPENDLIRRVATFVGILFITAYLVAVLNVTAWFQYDQAWWLPALLTLVPAAMGGTWGWLRYKMKLLEKRGLYANPRDVLFCYRIANTISHKDLLGRSVPTFDRILHRLSNRRPTK